MIESCKAGSAEGSSRAAARASKQSPLPPAPGRVTDRRHSPIPSTVSGCVSEEARPLAPASFSRAARTHHQHKRPLRPDLRFQASSTSPIAFVLPWKMGRVQNQKIQAAKRDDFQRALSCQDFLSALPFYLTRKKSRK